MKKLLFGAMLLALAISVPIPTMAQVSVQIGIALPPPIAFPAPPAVILLPNTGVYVAPDLAVDSSSSMVGGGVRGKDAGIAHGIIAQGGHIIMVSHLFMEEYLQDGEMNIGSIVGMAGNGIINE